MLSEPAGRTRGRPVGRAASNPGPPWRKTSNGPGIGDLAREQLDLRAIEGGMVERHLEGVLDTNQPRGRGRCARLKVVPVWTRFASHELTLPRALRKKTAPVTAPSGSRSLRLVADQAE